MKGQSLWAAKSAWSIMSNFEGTRTSDKRLDVATLYGELASKVTIPGRMANKRPHSICDGNR